MLLLVRCLGMTAACHPGLLFRFLLSRVRCTVTVLMEGWPVHISPLAGAMASIYLFALSRFYYQADEGVSAMSRVEATQRFGIVQRFNQDPSISVMLLTTSVGGLGLNLTAADTVIFLEHDWNPMKDLQVRALQSSCKYS